LAINDSGQIVGNSALAPGSADPVHAFLYQNGVMTDLGTLENSNGTSFAQAINNSGQIAGGSDGIPGGRRPFLYSGGQMTDLGTLPGYMGSASAFGINNRGQVVGADNLSDRLGGDPGFAHAFLWQNGSMTDLGTLGGTGSVATAINDSGQVVGYSTTADGQTDAFLYAGGAMTDLGAGIAWGINSLGQVVGSATPQGGGALLYSGGVAIDLNTLIPSDSGWHLLEAHAINDSGQIVGYGTINGTIHGFELNPTSTPEPSGLVLSLIGAGFLLVAWVRARVTFRSASTAAPDAP
jgi:probable HAF family extracellular repeat protein